jgi:L-lactate dehydrogenase (cytochrome)
LEVLFDGGILSGQDLLKALASGARAGLIGKAFLYGLGAMGEEGVTQVIELIRRELSVSMALTGQTDVRMLAPDVIWREPPESIFPIVSAPFEDVPCRR